MAVCASCSHLAQAQENAVQGSEMPDNAPPADAPDALNAISNSGVSVATGGSSDSGPMGDRLLFRARKALREQPGATAGTADTLGAPGGYHWIILMQVARYRDSNVRLTNMRRGVQRFLTELAKSRQAQGAAQTKDTISVLPYHFSLLGEARQRVQPLGEFLGAAPRFEVPSDPQNDKYQGQNWRDGHDWRAAMQQTLEWMRKNDLDSRHAVIVVLDWNDLAQAPLTLADGSKPAAPATDADLVLPINPTRFQAYSDTMQDAGLDPKKGLETVQVGNLEYDLAVFTPKNLEPILPSGTPTPTPTVGPPGCPPKCPPQGPDFPYWILLIPVLGGAAFFLLKPISFRLDEQESRQVSALPAKTLPILGKKTEAKGAHYRVPSVNLDTERPLASIQTDFTKKLTIINGALNAQNAEGFESTPNGLRLRGQKGEFELVDSATGRVVTSISLRRL